MHYILIILKLKSYFESKHFNKFLFDIFSDTRQEKTDGSSRSYDSKLTNKVKKKHFCYMRRPCIMLCWLLDIIQWNLFSSLSSKDTCTVKILSIFSLKFWHKFKLICHTVRSMQRNYLQDISVWLFLLKTQNFNSILSLKKITNGYIHLLLQCYLMYRKSNIIHRPLRSL